MLKELGFEKSEIEKIGRYPISRAWEALMNVITLGAHRPIYARALMGRAALGAKAISGPEREVALRLAKSGLSAGKTYPISRALTRKSLFGRNVAAKAYLGRAEKMPRTVVKPKTLSEKFTTTAKTIFKKTEPVKLKKITSSDKIILDAMRKNKVEQMEMMLKQLSDRI